MKLWASIVFDLNGPQRKHINRGDLTSRRWDHAVRAPALLPRWRRGRIRRQRVTAYRSVRDNC